MRPPSDVIDVDAQPDGDLPLLLETDPTTFLVPFAATPPPRNAHSNNSASYDPKATAVAVVAATAADDDDADDPTDPTPDVHALFALYNKRHFQGKLTNVYVEFSTRMTLCAGTCTYRGPAGGCRIALSEPLLKLRPATDLRSTLLHEMIHAFLFGKGVSRDGPDGHGPMFMTIARRINQVEGRHGIEITPYHTFNDEVDHYRTHIWKCRRCQRLVKRAMNRPPAPRDPFWPKHELTCGGEFVKIAEPPKKEKAKKPKSQRPNSKTNIPVVAVPMNKHKKNGGSAENNRDQQTRSVPKTSGGRDSGDGSLLEQTNIIIDRNSNDDNRNIVKTFRIDELLGASSSARIAKAKAPRGSSTQRAPIIDITSNNGPARPTNMVHCPVCNTRVEERLLNRHLDDCLAKDFASVDDSKEEAVVVPNNSKPGPSTIHNHIVDEIIIPSTPTPPCSPSTRKPVVPPTTTSIELDINDFNIVHDYSAHDIAVPQPPISSIPSPPSSPEITAVNIRKPPSTSDHPRPASPNRRSQLEQHATPHSLFTGHGPSHLKPSTQHHPSTLLKRRQPSVSSDATNTERFVNFVLNPSSQNPAHVKEMGTILIRSPSKTADRDCILAASKRTSPFRDLLRKPSPSDYAKLAHRKMMSAHFSTSSSSPPQAVSFAALARMQRAQSDPTRSFMTVVRHPDVVRTANGTGLVVPPHVLEQVIHQPQEIVANDVKRIPKRPKTINEISAKRNNNEAALVNSDANPNPITQQQPQQHQHQHQTGTNGAAAGSSRDADFYGKCPICDKRILKQQLEIHVNSCLDDANLTTEFCTVNEVTDTTRNEPDATADHPRCPICDLAVPRNELEAHVNSCMSMAGLEDAF